MQYGMLMTCPGLIVLQAAALSWLLSACSGHEDTQTPVLNWYVFDEKSGAFQEAVRHCTALAGGRYRIRITPLPADADQQREQLVRRLAARDSDIDIIGMDVIWTAEFAQAGWITPWPETQAAKFTAGMLPAAVESATYQGRLWAVPYTSNAQLLWYRKDLADPPATWDEMIDAAEALNVRGALQVQGQRYEGLTVFFISLLASAGGAVLSLDDSHVSLEEGPTRRALDLMKRIGASQAADLALSTMREDQNRLAFETGAPVFMVNYSYVWPSARRNAPGIAEQMGWARWPAVMEGRPGMVTIGGVNLGIGAYSRHPDMAFEAAQCLASKTNQIVAAQKGGMPPTIEALYQTPEVRQRFPMADTLLATLQNAVQRPRTPLYYDLSLAISHTLHPLKNIDPEADTIRLREAVTKALKSEGLF
jgi:multiple sugar transport system substrate-binding protein